MKLTKAYIHGTNGGYAYHGCRCDECKAARAKYMREYRQMRKRMRERRKVVEWNG